MKSTVISILSIFLLVSSCKKDEDTPSGTTGGGSNFRLTAPFCVISSGKSVFGNTTITYDSQKRIVLQSQNNDSIMTSFAYVGNTIIETTNEKLEDGSIEITTSKHYLNTAGFIDSTVNESFSSTIYYQYNSQGYLLRTFSKSQSGNILGGTSYQYANGNKMAEYALSFDWQTGAVKDSMLTVSFSYYPTIIGKMEELEAWTTRLGRASNNAVKTISYGSDTDTYTYILDSRGNPTKIEINGVTVVELTWECR